MSTIKKIEKDLACARKEKKNTVFWLSTLLAEVKAIGKNDGNRETTEEETMKMIQKFRKGVLETEDILLKKGKAENEAKLQELKAEREVYESYLPKMMTEEELRIVIKEAVSGLDNPNMGAVMKLLKEKYAGTYDGKLASSLVKDILR